MSLALRLTGVIEHKTAITHPHFDTDSETLHRCKVECICPESVVHIVGRVIPLLDAEQVGRLFSVLTDPTRIRIVHVLSMSSELCVCDIAFLVDMSQSAVSHQLRTLRVSGMVTRRKEGRTMFYSLSDEHVRILLRNGLDHIEEIDNLT